MNDVLGADASSALVQYGRILRTHWRWLVWAVLLALATATVFLILQPPMYRTEATVFVRTPGDVSKVLDGGDSYAQGRARTYAALAGGASVTTRVTEDLGLDIKPEALSKRVHAKNPPGTALIDIAVSAPSPTEAQRTSTVLLDEFAATVRTLEAVPGSVVPRAELVVVNRPGTPVRVSAFGAPVSVILLAAAVVGLVVGALAAVLRSIFEPARADAGDAPDIVRPDETALAGVPTARLNATFGETIAGADAAGVESTSASTVAPAEARGAEDEWPPPRGEEIETITADQDRPAETEDESSR